MEFIPRKESRAERKSKSSRSTEQGIAGHQAAMSAIGRAVGEPKAKNKTAALNIKIDSEYSRS
jgi:hypothetical protein